MSKKSLYLYEEFQKDSIPRGSQKVSIADIDSRSAGRMDVAIDNFEIETYLVNRESNRLFVFFSSAGRSDGATKFHRVSWSSKINALCLFVEDPMYKMHPGIPNGWYYGTAEKSVLKAISQIIIQIASVRRIKIKDVTLVGSSSAGYAALYMGCMIEGVNVFSINPQLTLSDWSDAAKFMEFTGIDLKNKDLHSRNSILNIIEKCGSKLHILFNMYSGADRNQVSPLLEKFGLKAEDGIIRRESLQLMLTTIKQKSPHKVNPDIDDFLMLYSLIDAEHDVNLIKTYLNKMKNNMELQESLRYTEHWAKFIEDGIPSVLKRTVGMDGSQLYLTVPKFRKSFRFRVNSFLPEGHGAVALDLLQKELFDDLRVIELYSMACNDLTARKSINSSSTVMTLEVPFVSGEANRALYKLVEYMLVKLAAICVEKSRIKLG